MGNEDKVPANPIMKCVECGRYDKNYTHVIAVCPYCGNFLCEHCLVPGTHVTMDQLAGRKAIYGIDHKSERWPLNARFRWCV